jgi:hypothetical protein
MYMVSFITPAQWADIMFRCIATAEGLYSCHPFHAAPDYDARTPALGHLQHVVTHEPRTLVTTITRHARLVHS